MGMNNIEAILGCRKTFNLTASEFLFLWYLAFRGNDEDREYAVRGEAWPGYPSIEAEIGLDPDTTRKASKRLSGLGVLTVHETGYKDRASKTYVVDYARIAEYLKDAVGDSPTPGASITDPQSADYAPPVGELPTQGRRITHRTGIQQEQKKNVNGNEQKQRSFVSTICSFETTGETPVPPEEQEKLEWAKGLTPHPSWIGWKKFTDNPKSFRKACLESETFNKQFADRKKKSAKNGNPAHAGGGLMAEALAKQNSAHRGPNFLAEAAVRPYDSAREAEAEKRQREEREEQDRYNAARTCVHCKSFGPEILRYGYCRDCVHNDPDSEHHNYFCECDKCTARRAVNPPKIKTAPAPRVKEPMFEEDPL